VHFLITKKYLDDGSFIQKKHAFLLFTSRGELIYNLYPSKAALISSSGLQLGAATRKGVVNHFGRE